MGCLKTYECPGGQGLAMSKARRVITVVVVKGRTQGEVARAYGASRGLLPGRHAHVGALRGTGNGPQAPRGRRRSSRGRGGPRPVGQKTRRRHHRHRCRHSGRRRLPGHHRRRRQRRLRSRHLRCRRLCHEHPTQPLDHRRSHQLHRHQRSRLRRRRPRHRSHRRRRQHRRQSRRTPHQNRRRQSPRQHSKGDRWCSKAAAEPKGGWQDSDRRTKRRACQACQCSRG